MPEETIEYVNFKGRRKTVSTKKWDLKLILPIKESESISYCLLSDINKACENNNLEYKSFLDWITGQTCPLVEEEGNNKFDCIYSWDVDRWMYYQIKHKITPRVLD